MKKLIFIPFLLLTFALFSQESYKIGDIVSPFKLKNIDSKMVDVNAKTAQNGYILIFTCNHCPFSVLYEDRIIELQRQFKSKGYPVIAINSNDAEQYPEDSFDNMIVRAKEKGFTFPSLYDETQEIAKAFGATRTPHVFVVQKVKDQLRLEYVGAIDDNAKEPENVKTKYLEAAVNALLAGNEVAEKVTKAIGCTIKWKK